MCAAAAAHSMASALTSRTQGPALSPDTCLWFTTLTDADTPSTIAYDPHHHRATSLTVANTESAGAMDEPAPSLQPTWLMSPLAALPLTSQLLPRLLPQLLTIDRSLSAVLSAGDSSLCTHDTRDSNSGLRPRAAAAAASAAAAPAGGFLGS